MAFEGGFDNTKLTKNCLQSKPASKRRHYREGRGRWCDINDTGAGGAQGADGLSIPVQEIPSQHIGRDAETGVYWDQGANLMQKLQNQSVREATSSAKVESGLGQHRQCHPAGVKGTFDIDPPDCIVKMFAKTEQFP